MPAMADDRFILLERLLRLERDAEKEHHRAELERLPISTREALGRTVSRLGIDGLEHGPGGYPRLAVSREAAAGGLSPFHGMNQGDSVRLTFPDGTEPAFVDGTLESVAESRAAVAVDARLPDPLPVGRCRLDLLGSEATYRRSAKALAEVAGAKSGDAARLRDVSLGLKPARSADPGPVDFLDPGLNEWQREAVRRALAAEDFALIHGPPGTGKTTALVEVIRQAAARGRRVLAGAPSNIAVDNLLEKLLGTGLRVVRLGHPAKTLEALRHGTLRYQLAEDPQYAAVQEMDAWRERLSRQLARSGSRGLAGRERDEKAREVQRLWHEARKSELALSRRIVLSAQVVLSTHGGLTSRLLRGGFDLAVLDEASQAVEPLSWIAASRAKRVVFAGDSNQLPPTIYSREAAQEGLALTLFERLMPVLPPGCQSLLRLQYRMNEGIMAFPSAELYDGKLIADESVRRHLARELPGVADTELTRAPLAFVDTAGAGFEETFDEVLQSRANEGEARLAARLARELLAAGLPAGGLAVLSPYVAQVRALKDLLRAEGLEIGTVDGFQGREKEAVIISLVRSNERGEVGFLSDIRRMNVAVTRARRLLVVIGDSATLAHHPFYRRFLDYAETLGAHRSAYEWPDD